MISTKASQSQAIAQGAKAVVKLYDFSNETKVSLLSESENKVYLVDDPAMSEKYVLRVNSGRLTYHTPASIASEMSWLIAICNDTDIVVPKVLTAKDGSLVQTISAPDLDKPRYATIYSFLPGGEPPEDDLLSGFMNLGEISARLHRHAINWSPVNNYQRHEWSTEAILDDRLNWGPWQMGVAVEGEILNLLSRLDQIVRTRLAVLPTEKQHYGLIHADLRLANILVDGEQTAIIDFDDCGYGWFMFDLASALSFLEQRSDVEDLIESWKVGYRKISDLPAVIEAEIPTMIMLRRLQLIGWVGYQQQHLEFAREIGYQFTLDTCRLAENYFKRFA